MSEKIQEHWKSEIIQFFEQNISESRLFKARKFIDDKNKEIDKEKNEKKLKRLTASKEKKLQELVGYRQQAVHGEIYDWIASKVGNKKISAGKRILKSTHVLKFSHSSSVGAGVNIEKDFPMKPVNNQFLTTDHLAEITHDLAHNNGNLITISRFLFLQYDGKMIYDFILDNDFSFLEPFSLNKGELESWKVSISNLIEEREIDTALLTKQIYFPLGLNETKNYHLLVPLFSSSLCQEIYSETYEINFDERHKNIRKQEKDSFFHDSASIQFLNLAIQNFGGDYPRNVSMLNANRSGRSFLFNAQPPVWQNQLEPPARYASMFNVPALNYACTDDIASLREMLMNTLDVYKKPEIMKGLQNWVKSIADEVLTYVSQIQYLEAGWSKDSNLSKHAISHCYLLDVYRNDDDFQLSRKRNEWQAIVSDNFARWLNQKIAGKDKRFTPQPEHRKIWKSVFADKLRIYMETIAIEVGE